MILHSNGIMRMLTNNWKVKIVTILGSTWKYRRILTGDIEQYGDYNKVVEIETYVGWIW